MHWVDELSLYTCTMALPSWSVQAGQDAPQHLHPKSVGIELCCKYLSPSRVKPKPQNCMLQLTAVLKAPPNNEAPHTASAMQHNVFQGQCTAPRAV